MFLRRILPLFLAVLVALGSVAPAHADDGPGEPPDNLSVRAWLQGEPKLGSGLSVGWDIKNGENAGLYYRWFCDGQPTGNTLQSFPLDDTSCLGQVVSVEFTLYNHQDDWIWSEVLEAPGPVVTGPVGVIARMIGTGHRTQTPVWADVYTTPEGADVSYQWYADGVVVPGATARSFTPPRSMLGQRLSIAVTGRAPQWEVGTETSEPTAPLKPGWLADGVRITGAVEVGREVSADPTGLGAPESFTYAWTLDGVAIRGATSPTLTPGAAMVGRQLRAVVTVSGLGRTEVLTSAPSTVRGGQLTTGKIQLTGSATVGWVLEARPPKWATTPTTLTHQWYRRDADGVARKLPGATGARYRLAPSDQDRQVFVEMSATAPGRNPVTLRSDPSQPISFSVYTTPGEHLVNGRKWRTVCEPYSQTQRCRTEIWATQISERGGRFVSTTGWVFNNLTYLASPRSLWAGNPLASNQHFEAGGRRWNSVCDVPAVGRNACRVHIESTTIHRSGNGYYKKTDWVFNNVIHFG